MGFDITTPEQDSSPMRTSTLLALAAFLPATSQATLLINGSWDTMAGAQNATSSYYIHPNSNNNDPIAAIQLYDPNSYGGLWQLDSITIDGITPYGTAWYTPTASDFSLSIISPITQSVVSTVTASSVGSYVSNGDGSSRFSITFTNIPSPQVNNGMFTGFLGSGAFYSLDLNVIAYSGFNFGYDSYGLTYRGWNFVGGGVLDGEVAGVTWGGPAPIVVYGTNSWGAPPAVPEPSTYGLIGLGALGLAFVARRRKAKTA